MKNQLFVVFLRDRYSVNASNEQGSLFIEKKSTQVTTLNQKKRNILQKFKKKLLNIHILKPLLENMKQLLLMTENILKKTLNSMYNIKQLTPKQVNYTMAKEIIKKPSCPLDKKQI